MQLQRLDEGLFRSTAPNGVTVLSEFLPGLRSVALGMWVRSASAHEPRREMGVAHLLEHMVFKGTARRSARQIALELEVRGGSLDAYTSRDHTSYQAHSIDSDLPLAVDTLTDLIHRPLLRASDLTLERNVVLEEINGVQDTPDDLVFELHSETLWPDHPYGYSILGTAETVGGLEAADLARVHRSGYYRGNCVIAAAGNVDHERLVELLAREGWLETDTFEAPREPVAPAPAARGVERFEQRDSTQAHLVIGTDTFPARDPRRFALAMLTNVFGGGMSSRMFQRIREELGLAYAVYAFQHFYQSSGQIGVYVGTQPGTAAQALDAIRREFGTLASSGLTREEFDGGKQQLKGQLVLSFENPMGRMNRLAGFVLNGDRYRRLDELLAEVDAVTEDQVSALAGEFFAPERQTVVRLGPLTA